MPSDENSPFQFATVKSEPSTFVLEANQGTTIGSYRLLGPLGAGGMGALFRAEHCKLKKVVALKVIRLDHQADGEAAKRFAREIEALGQMHHEHIVQAFDAGEASGITYLAMELIEGCDVELLCQSHGRLPWQAAGEIIRQAALGLQHAHDRGFLHRDIKPSNLLVNTQGVVKIADLGLARFAHSATGESLTETAQIVGTADYLSPEQACGTAESLCVRSDLYSLGCTLYRMIAGKVPFAAPEYDTREKKVLAHATEQPRPLEEICPNVPEQLLDLVDQLLQKKPSLRIGSAGEVAAVLKQLAVTLPPEMISHARQWKRPTTNEAVQATRPFSTTHRKRNSSPAQSSERPSRKWYWVASFGVIIFLGIIVTAGLAPYFRLATIAGPEKRQLDVSSLEPLPFDDTKLPSQPRRNEWIRLLDRHEPKPLFWPAGDASALRLFRPDLNQLVLNSPGFGMVPLGRLASPGYRVRVDLIQHGWSGDCGLFWNAHLEPIEKRPAWFMQLLTLRHDKSIGGRDAYKLVRSTFHVSHDEDVGVQSFDLAQDDVTVLLGPPQTLEVELSSIGPINVRWNGEIIKDAVNHESGQGSEFALNECRGLFGVFVHGSDCTFSNAQVLRVE